MLLQLSIGVISSVCNIIIHALFMDVVISLTRLEGARLRPGRLALGRIMVVAVCVLMAAHILEVFVWALIYRLVGAAPVDSGLVYFAFVNFATLGYGDIVPVTEWKLLGPMTAMNGILLFGWSTAVIFEVLTLSLSVLGSRSLKGTQKEI